MWRAFTEDHRGSEGYNTYKGLTDSAGNFDAKNAADITINLSYGSSESESKSSSQSNTAAGSTIAAGNNLTIVATGAGQASNLTAQGATLTAGNNVTLLAENQVNLLASQSHASQESSNSSSSSSVGVSYGIISQNVSASASASQSQGNSNGSDTSYTNTQVTAGNTASIISGGDTNLIGAVVTANTVKANVGGNLNIASLQDTSTYTSEQSSSSASVSFGKGGATGGGISASNSNIDSNYASVVQQSGIKAGDGGFQVDVAGNTDLKGAVIASTQAAVDNNKNSFSTGGVLTLSDIQNNASYDGKAAGLSIDVGQQAGKFGVSGVGAGIGSDKGEASSTSTAGISGIAGNTAVRSTDAETGISKIFDADRVQREINAQVQIMQAFTKEAPKATASFAAGQAADLRKAGKEEEAKKWDEGGIYRIALHTLTGALSGGVGGAAGGAASASAANLMNDFQDGIQKGLEDAGMSASAAKAIAQGLATATAAGIGAAVGGVQGAVTAATVDANNRQLHQIEKDLIKKLAKGDAALEKQLEQIACVDTHCADGKSDSDPVKAELLADKQYLLEHPQEFAEARKIYEAAKAETQLFGYTPSDQRLDAINAGDTRSGLYGLTAAELVAKNQATAACGTNKVCSEQVASQYNRTASDRSEFNLALENLVRSANSCIDLDCSKDALKQLSLYRQDIAYQYHACQDDACRAGTRYAALPLFTALAGLRGQTNDPQFLADAARLLAMGLGENSQNGAALISTPGVTVPTRGNGRGITNGGNGAVAIDESLASLNSPATRHYADKVTQTSVAKEVNTVIDRAVVDISADVAAIRSGQAQNVGDTFVVNGRTYGMHDGTLYPMSGPGLYTLDRGGYKALGVLNKFGDTPQAEIILKNMGVSAETKAAALVVFKATKK